MDIEPPTASSDRLDAEAIASRVRSVLAEALSTAQSPLQMVVRVARDEVDITLFHAAARIPPDAKGWSFATWFRGRLHERRLTQEGVARTLGVSSKTVNRWAKGDTEPRFRELVMLYEALGESPFVPEPAGTTAP